MYEPGPGATTAETMGRRSRGAPLGLQPMLLRGRWLGIAVLIALALVGCGSQGVPLAGKPGTVERAISVLRALKPGYLAARVEQLRGLKFSSIPTFTVLTAAQAVALGRSSLAFQQPAITQDTTLMRLTGIVPPSFNMDTYYSILSDGGGALAHKVTLVASPAFANHASAVENAVEELTIALDLQNFHPQTYPASSEAGKAQVSLLEGDAHVIGVEYAKRYGLAVPSTVPPDIASLPFPLEFNIYDEINQGADFVTALKAHANGYTLVNRALSSDPPRSLAEIISPVRYLRHIAPVSIKMSGINFFGPRGRYLEVIDQAFDPIDAIDLLATNARETGPPDTAAAWDGGRVELWREGSDTCPGACAHRAFAVLATEWLTPEAANSFGALLYKRLRAEHGRLVNTQAWTFPDAEFKLRDGGYASINIGPEDVAVAWAPTAASATTLGITVGLGQKATL